MPEIARKIGKIMAEFRTTTNEFRSTWEREVNFESEVKALDIDLMEEERADRQAGELNADASETKNSIGAPQVNEIDRERFEQLVPRNSSAKNSANDEPAEEADVLSDKRTWL